MRFVKEISPKRRALLRSLGMASLGLPFLEMFRPRPVGAAMAKRAKFAVFLYSPNGVHQPSFWPQGAETGFTLGSVLEPLNEHREKLLVIGPADASSGLAHVAGVPQHQAQVCLTGDPVRAPYIQQTGDGLNVRALGPSLDQLIASQLPERTKFRSLEFGVHPVGGDTPSVINFTADGSPMRRMVDPDRAWRDIFDGIGASGGDSSRKAARERRVAVSNFLHKRFAAVAPRLGKSDRLILDSHLASLRETETRLLMTDRTPSGDCAAPVLAAVPKDDASIRSRADSKILAENFVDMIASAFACDLTRVASITFGYPGGGGTGGLRVPWLGVTGYHHELSHHGNQPQRVDGYNKITGWIASQMASLLSKLKKIPFEGGTVADHVLVYWFSRHGDGNSHSNHALPAVIGGGTGGAFRMGRFLRIAKSNNNQLLIAIAQAMGVPLEEFGYGTLKARGALAGLT